MDTNVKQLMTNLDLKGYEAIYCKTTDEVFPIINSLLPEHASIGFGGSRTVESLDLPIRLMQKGYNVLHYSMHKDWTTHDRFLQDVKADAYICSSNAITVKGELVNTDGTCNRVANMSYGANMLIVVVGVNKIVNDIDAAIERIRNYAAPMNAKRLNRKTPCVIDGKCHDCSSPDRICKETLITHRPPTGRRVVVIVVDSELGF